MAEYAQPIKQTSPLTTQPSTSNLSTPFSPGQGLNPAIPLTPANILALQRTVGNKAVQRLLQKQKHQAPSSPVATIQREDYTQEQTDADTDYDGISETAIGQRYLLKKPKTVRKETKTDATSLGAIPAKRLVEVVEKPKKVGTRSWAKIKANIEGKAVEGWINTKNALEEGSKVVGHKEAGIIMAKEPTVEDIAQNMFGDCFLLSALMSLVRQDPGYIKKRLFVTDPTKTQEEHTLRFFAILGEVQKPSGFREDTVTVKNTILTTLQDMIGNKGPVEAGSYGSNGAQPWPAIVEKAFTVWKGKDERSSLVGGQGDWASMYLMGEAYESLGLTLTKGELKQMSAEQRKETLEKKQTVILKALQDGGLITAGTLSNPPQEWIENNPNQSADKGSSGEEKWGGIAFGHVYEVVAANDKTITLRNPWGKFGRVNGKVEPEAAESILSWEEFFMVCGNVSHKSATQPNKNK